MKSKKAVITIAATFLGLALTVLVFAQTQQRL